MRKVDKVLKGWTGEGARWWMDWVEKRVASCIKEFYPKDHPSGGMGVMDTEKCWTAELAREVQDRIWGSWGKRNVGWGDGNLAVSIVLSLILVLWTARVGRAKTFDPDRYGKKAQRFMYAKAILPYYQVILEALTDESRDHLFFPEQRWASPFVPLRKQGAK